MFVNWILDVKVSLYIDLWGFMVRMEVRFNRVGYGEGDFCCKLFRCES